MRSIIAIIIGFAVMLGIIVIGKGVAFESLGVGFMTEEGSWKQSLLSVLSIDVPLGLVAALFGGFLCAAIAKTARTALILAVLILGWGLAMSFFGLSNSEDTSTGNPLTEVVREAESAMIEAEKEQIGFREAMEKTQSNTPTWYYFAMAFVGFFGALSGARMAKSFKKGSD